MRNFLLLFINILVFSSISFSQIVPSTNIVCVGNSATFSYTGAVPAGSIYAWGFTNGSPNSSTAAIPPPIFFSSAGIGQVTLIITPPAAAQINPQFINIQVLGSNPSISVNNPNSNYCVGSSISPIVYTISGGACPTLTSGSLNGLTSTCNPISFLGFTSGHTFTITGTPTTPGCLTAIYSSPSLGGCSGSTSINLSSICVNSKPTVTSISYGSPSFCTTAGPQSVSLNGSNGTIYSGGSPSAWSFSSGVYSAPSGLTINTSTGEITPSTSTPGTYTVTYTIAAANGCTPVTSTTIVTITGLPTANLSYPSSPWCNSITSQQLPSLSGTNVYQPGIYSSPTLSSINASTGAIIPSTNPTGPHTVTYTIAAAGGCASVSATTATPVTINPIPIATAFVIGNSTICSGQNAILELSSNIGFNYQWLLNNNPATEPGNSGVISTGFETYSVSLPGNYTLRVTDPTTNCFSTTTNLLTIVVLPLPSLVVSASPRFLCLGQSTILSGPTGPSISFVDWYDSNDGLIGIGSPYTWAYPASSDVIYAEIMGSNGCSAISSTISIGVMPLPPVPSIVSSLPSSGTECSPNCVTLFSNTLPLPNMSYSWSSGGGPGISASYCNTGSYTVTHSIIYSNNAFTPSTLTCTNASLPQLVTINPAPTTPTIIASGGLTSTTFCSGSSITLSVPNLPNTDFEWSNGSFISSITVNSPGSYSVRIRNTITGCWSNYATYTVTMIPLPIPIILSPPSPVCLAAGGSVTLSSNYPAGNSWSGCVASSSTSSLNVSVSCLYTLTVTQAGCSASTSLNLTINPRPSAVITQSGSLNICTGSCVTLSAVNSPNTLYAWYTTSAGGPPIGTNYNYVACSPGTYYVVITDNTTGCSSTSINYTVTTLTSPLNTITIQVPGTNTFCQGGSATLVGPTAPIGTTYTYQWYNTSGPLGIGINQNATISGTYYCMITNSNTLCTIQSNSIIITVNPNPTAIINPTTNLCVGAVLTASGIPIVSYSYCWIFNGGPCVSGTNTYNSTTAGNVSVRLTDPNGCIGNSSTVTINALPTTPVISGITPFCAGTSTTLSTPLVASSTYTWSPPGGIVGPTQNIYTVSTGGTYSVTITNSNGCSSTSLTYPVIMTPTPITPTISPAGPISLCVGQTQILTATSPSGAGTNLWNGGTPTNLVATTISNSISGSGSYTYTVTINGCPATSAPVIVTFNPNPSIPTLTSSATTLCAYPTSNVILTSSTAAPGIAYSWNGGTTPGNNQTNSITPSSNGTGSYFVTHTNTTTGCSSISNSIPVTFNPLPSITITPNGPTNYCQSGTVTLSSTVVPALMIPTVYAYSWTASPAAVTSAPSGANLTFLSTSLAGTYTYTLQATNPTTGCVGYSLPQTIQINPNPIATITPSGSSTFCQGSNVILTAGPTGNSYVWSGSPFNGSTLSAITVSTTGTYAVTVTNSFGCGNTSPTQTVAVTANPITPIITSPITTAICSGNSLILTFNNPTINTTHRWYETSLGLVQIGGATYAATTSGTYYLVTTSTLSPSCFSTSNLITVTVNANPSTPIISPNIATPICQGNSVTLSAGSYDPNLTYTWTPSSSNAGGSLTDDNINNVTATGNYVVTVSNSNGCSALSLPYTVTVNPLPIVPIVIASGPITFCAGASVNLIVSTPVVGHIYDWYLSGGSVPVFTGTTYTIINSGIYFVKARNPITLCESNSSTTTITVNPLPTAAITPAGPITVCDGDLLTLTAFNSPGYSFSWGISNTIVISSSGIYNVTVTLNGCSINSNSVTVNYIPNPSPIIISSPVSLEACNGGSVNLSVGGIFPLTACTYEWFNSAGATVQGPGTNSSYIATSSGTYRVKATSTLGYFCSSFSAPVTVTIHPNINAQIIVPSTSTSFCEGTTSITLTADPLIGYTYVWSNGQTSPTINLSLASQSGPYTVTVTNSLTNCSATSPIIPISIYPNPSAPSISPIGPLNSCAGNPLLILTASPSTFPTYQWKNGDDNVGSNSPSHNPASTGSYSVIATNSNGCSSLPSIPTFITINPTPATPVIIPQTGSPLQFCQGGSINLSATINSGSTYQWFRNGIQYISGNPVNITLSGSYTLIETTNLGCSSQTSSPLIITVYPNPTPVITALGPTEFCANLGASVTLQATPGSNLYQWTCVSPSLPTQAASSSPNFIATQTGTYTVTTTTSNNCISAVSNSITVVVNPLPVATITPGSATSFCADPGAFVTLTAGPSGNFYEWSTSGTALGNPLLASQNITQTGMYSVLVTNPITNCTNTASLPVTVHPLPTPSIIASGITIPLCDGQSVVLTADPIGSGLTYLWSPFSFTSIATPPITLSGTYSVQITDANGCSATSAIVPVVFNSNPLAFITPNSLPTLCQGDTITLQSNPMSDNYVWSQQLGSGYTIIASGISSIPVWQSGIYTVTNYNPSGCFTTSTPITVTLNPLPTPLISVIGGNTEVCQGNSVFLSVSGIGITSYQWRVNGVNIPGANSINYPATSSGVYSVEVGNNNNCFKISSGVTVTINPNPTAVINYLNSPDPILLCPGGTIGLTAGPSNMYYSWNSPNLGFETNQFVLATASGTYEVIVTDPATGCFDTSDPVNVTMQTLGSTPAAVIGMPSTLTLCPGSLFTLSGITSNASSFNWTLISAPAGCNLIGASTLNPTFTSGTVSGQAILRLNTSLNYACNTVSSYQDITINISPSIPTLSNNINSGLIDQVLCSNIPIDPIIFNVLDILGSGTTIPSVTIDGTTVLSSTPYNGISWNFIGGQVVISGTPNFGTYTYTVNGIPTGSPSCLSTSLSGTITSQAASLSIFSGEFTNNQIICIGTSIAPIIYDYTGIIASIDLPEGVIAQSNTSGNQYTISGTPLAVGYYNYAITTETVCGFETLLGEITVIPPITGNTSGTATTTNCDGSEFTLIGGILNSSANTNYTYLWVYSTSITGPYDPAPGINTNANYEGTIYLANDTLYFRRFVYAGDCYDFAAPVMVQVIPLGTNPNMIAFAGADQTISLGQSVELVTTGVNISEYNWSPTNGLSSSTISNPFASPVSTTIYTLTVQDIYGCSYSDDLTVTVLTDYSLTIPSLITPNDDGSNDFWEIPESLFYTGTTVKIINREGQEVYSSSSYDNTWDGTFNGKLLPEATYYYFIQFPNSEITHKGPVTILRNIK